MRDEDKNYTTFISHRDLYRFTVMPFGLMNAPTTFSRIMRNLLENRKGLDNYLDDVLAHTVSWEDHISVLREFFEKIREVKLTLRPSKCEIGRRSVKFLGHQVGETGIEPCAHLVSKIADASKPLDKKQLCLFLGLVGYYRKSVPNFATVAAPLTELTQKTYPNMLKEVWGEAQDRAFCSLKQYVVAPTVLSFSNFSKQFMLLTDASD